MNNVVLVGRLTKENEIRTSANGITNIRNTIAVNRNTKNNDGQYEADFISIVVFGKTADILAKYSSKGSQIGITGRIQTGSYEKEGQKYYTTDVIVETLKLLDTKGNTAETETKKENDPFAEFGETVTADDMLD